MNGEIDNDFYCTADLHSGDKKLRVADHPSGDILTGNCCNHCVESRCHCRHRKHPTPAQFKEEYGFDVPPDMPVWVLIHATPKFTVDGKELEHKYIWSLDQYGNYEKHNSRWNMASKNINANFYLREIEAVVIACTPWGKPPDNWRPE